MLYIFLSAISNKLDLFDCEYVPDGICPEGIDRLNNAY